MANKPVGVPGRLGRGAVLGKGAILTGGAAALGTGWQRAASAQPRSNVPPNVPQSRPALRCGDDLAAMKSSAVGLAIPGRGMQGLQMLHVPAVIGLILVSGVRLVAGFFK